MTEKPKKSSQPTAAGVVESPTLATSSAVADTTHLNLVVLFGELSSDPVQRTLPSGDILTQYEVSMSGHGASPSTTAPVVLFDKEAGRSAAAGDSVVVIGSVRRRFYRAGGSTQSRTEVVASKVRITPQRRTIKAVSAAAFEALEALTG